MYPKPEAQPLQEAALPHQLRKEIEHSRRDSGSQTSAGTPPASPLHSPAGTPGGSNSPAGGRAGRQSVSLDEDVRPRPPREVLTSQQEALKFDFENLRQSAAIRADPLLASFDVPPPALELITVERKRRYPLPSNYVLRSPSTAGAH